MNQQGKFQIPARTEFSEVEILASAIAAGMDRVAIAMEQTMNSSAAANVRQVAYNLAQTAESIQERAQFDLANRNGPVRKMLKGLLRAAQNAGLHLSSDVTNIVQRLSISDYGTTEYDMGRALHDFYPNDKACEPGITLIVSSPPVDLRQTYIFSYPTFITNNVKIECTDHYHKYEVNQTYRNGARVKIFFDIGIGSNWLNGVEVYVVNDPLEGTAYRANLSFVNHEALKDQIEDALSRIGYDPAKRAQLDLYDYDVFKQNFSAFMANVKTKLPKFVNASFNRKPWTCDLWRTPGLDLYWGTDSDSDKLFWKFWFSTRDGRSTGGSTITIAGIDDKITRMDEGQYSLVFDEVDQQLFKAEDRHYDRNRKVMFDPTTWRRCMDMFRVAFEEHQKNFYYEVTHDIKLWALINPNTEPTEEQRRQFRIEDDD